MSGHKDAGTLTVFLGLLIATIVAVSIKLIKLILKLLLWFGRWLVERVKARS